MAASPSRRRINKPHPIVLFIRRRFRPGGNSIAGATVSGSWSTGGASSATTGANGVATVNSDDIRKNIDSTTWTVDQILYESSVYDSTASITVFKDGSFTVSQTSLAAQSTASGGETQSLTLSTADEEVSQAASFGLGEMVTRGRAMAAWAAGDRRESASEGGADAKRSAAWIAETRRAASLALAANFGSEIDRPALAVDDGNGDDGDAWASRVDDLLAGDGLEDLLRR